MGSTEMGSSRVGAVGQCLPHRRLSMATSKDCEQPLLILPWNLLSSPYNHQHLISFAKPVWKVSVL